MLFPTMALKSLNRLFIKVFSHTPLPTILVVPFVVQTVFAVGLVGYFAYKNGQEAVEDLTKQLMEEVGERISDRLDSHLQKPLESDFPLAEISNFLQKQHFSPSGQAFIIDRSGNLVATSTSELPYIKQAKNKPKRLPATHSQDPRTREIARQLTKRFGNFRHLQNPQQLSVISPAEKLFVRVVPYRDNYGLDWLVVVAIPKSDLMARINENTRITILFGIVSLLVTAGIAVLTAHSITQPILRLNAAAKKFKNGEIPGNIPVIAAKEIGELTDSFNQMAQVLSEYNRSLEAQVQEKTQAWQRSEAQINAFFASAPVGMGIVNNQLRLVKVNQVLAGIANFKIEENIGQSIREVVPEKILEKIEPLYQQVLATGEPILNLETSGELTARPREKWYWIVSYFPIFTADNCLDGVGVIVVDITAHKQLENILQEKSAELERFFSAALDLLCIADTDGYFRRLNVQWENILGYTLADLEGYRFLDFVHPDDLESTLNAIAELSQQQVILNFTNRYRHRDGSYRWLEWRSVPIGKLIYAAARDITDRQLAEVELLESKRLIEQVTESTSAILYIFDLVEQRNVYVNSQIERLLGYSPAEIYAMGDNVFPILIHPEDMPTVMEAHAGLLSRSDHQWMEVEYRMRDKQGEWHWLSSRDRILNRTASGQPAQILGTATDITDRKQTEAALRQSEERFQEIARTIDQLFFVRSISTGEFLYVNPAYEKIWGRSCESLYRDPQSWLAAIHPDDRPLVLSSMRQQFAPKSVKREYRIMRPDGEIRWIEAEISVVYDQAGNPQRLVGFAEDISDRKLAEIALAESEHKFSTIFHASPDPLWMATLSEGRCLNVNDSFVKFLEYPYPEIIGKTCVELKLWDKIEDLDRFRQALKSQGKLENFEVVFRTRSRQARTVLISATVSQINNQDCVIGLLKDITDRQLMEEALAREIIRSKTLLDSSVDGIVVLDSQANVLEANASFARMLGYTLEETLTLNLVDWDANWTAEEIEHKFFQNQPSSHTFETRHLRKDGSIYNVEISCNSIRWDDRIVHFCICRNITERKQLELALQSSEAKLNDILDSAVAAISSFRVFADGHWEIAYISAGCEMLSGYTPAELKADKNLWNSRIIPEDWQAVEADIYANIFAERKANYEYRLDHKDGSLRWISQTNSSRWDQAQNCWIVTAISVDITDRKQLQIALQTSETRLRAILDNTPAFIDGVRLTSNADWEYEYFSPSSEAIFGYKGSEIAADPFLILSQILPEDLETIVKPTMERLLTPNFATTIEYRLRHKDGRIRWVAHTLSTYCDQITQCWYGTGITIDITDRKLAEAALRESEIKFSTIFHASPDPIWMATLSEGRCLNINDSFVKFLEYPYPEIIGKTCVELKLWDKMEDLHRFRQALKSQGKLENFEVVFRTRSGQAKTVLISATVSQINNQDCIIGLLKDITDRKQLQIALQTSENRLRSVIDNAPAFISGVRFIDNDRWEYEYFSPGSHAICGYTSEEIAAHPSLLISLILPEDVETIVKPTLKRMLTPNFAATVEYRLRHKNGNLRWVANSLSTYWNETTKCWYGTGIIIDITDRKLAEEALQQIEFRLQHLAAASPAVMYIVVEDPNGPARYEYLSPVFEEIHEIPVPKVLENPAITFSQIHPDDRQGYQQKVAKAVETWELFRHEWRIITPSGKIKWIQANSRPQKRENGEIVWHGIVLDITDRKRAEETLQITLNRLQNLATAVPGNIYSLVKHSDGSLKFEYSNRALEEITELTLEQAFKDAENVIISQIHPEDRSGYLSAVDRSLETMETFKHQWRIITPSGQLKWLQGNSQPERRANGDIVWHGIVLDITERKIAEETLQITLTRLQNLATAVPGVLYSLALHPDDSLEFEYINRTVEEIHEISIHRVLEDAKRIIIDQMHPDDQPGYFDALSRSCESLEIFKHEWRITTPSGKIKWLQANSQPERRENGDVCWHGVVQDISDRKLAEKALRQSENALIEAQKIAHVGSWYFNIITQEITWSEEMFHILGRDPTQDNPSYDQLIQHTYPDDLELFLRNMELSITEGKAFQHEIRIVRSDGTIRYTFGKGQAVTNEIGQVVKTYGTVQDITDRKLAEIALRESLDRERTLFQFTQKIRQTLNLQTIFHTTTQELRETLGCSRISVYRFHPDYSGEFVAESIAPGWVLLVGEGINPVWQDTYLQETQGGRYRHQENLAVNDIYQAGLNDCHIQLLEQFQAKAFCVVPVCAGEQLWGLLSAYQNNHPRLWKAQEIQLLAQVGIQLGVAIQQAELFTQIQNQSLQLQQTAQAAEAANRSKSAFLANMSHELRTPLNAIIGFAQLIHQSPALLPEDRENIAVINRSGQHLLTLINDVLDMAKIEAGTTYLNEHSFNLHRLLYDLEKMFSLRAKEKKLQLNYKLDTRVPKYVRTDEIKLRQVLINLIGNAIKFTEAGRVLVLVSVAEKKPQITDQEQLTLHFEVEDTGSGVPENELEQIFEPFLQTRTGKQSQEGTGLGLAISRKFVQLMGGEITVSSRLGCGSNFKFDIQVGLVEPFDLETSKEPFGRVIALAPNQLRYRIMIVDDRWDNRQLLVKLLSTLGFEIKEAFDGFEALKLWETWQPHLIFMDMRIPGINGFEVTQQIKAREKENQANLSSAPPLSLPKWGEQSLVPKTAIVAVTASSFEAEKNAILAVGCDDFIRKPFQDSDIFDSLKKHLGVGYIYESIPGENDSGITEKITLDPAEIAALPANLVINLKKATVRANFHEISSIIDQIRPINSQLANALKYLIQQFDHASILAAIANSKQIKDN